MSQPHAAVLALWSLGLVLAPSCALRAVATLWGGGLERKANTGRPQLREWGDAAKAKRGEPRQALEGESGFAPLLGGVWRGWAGQPRALALEATARGARLVVLAVSVVQRGCASPGAWTVLPANQTHAWRGAGRRRRRQVRPAGPPPMTVLVRADRGLQARGLYRRRVRLGWQPCLRLHAGGTCRPADPNRFQPLTHFASQVGVRWQGRGPAFGSRPRRLDCPVRACGEEGHKEACFILTALPPASSAAGWQGLRAWIEPGFTLTKRGGGQWPRPRLSDPQRAARLGLAVAVATLGLLSVGGEAAESLPPSTLPDITAVVAQARRQRRATRWRLGSVCRQGWTLILGALLNHRRLPLGRFKPEPWPSVETRETKLQVTPELLLAA